MKAVRRDPGFEVFGPVDDTAAEFRVNGSGSVYPHLGKRTGGQPETVGGGNRVKYEAGIGGHWSITVKEPDNPGR
jgi:hypothetical protein